MPSQQKPIRKKYVSFAAQREQCRLNKYTYTETCDCGKVTLMCNYPFPDPTHRKGCCRANTCTDMRTLPDEIVEADKEQVTNEAPKPGAGVDDDGGTDAKASEEPVGKEADPAGAVRPE